MSLQNGIEKTSTIVKIEIELTHHPKPFSELYCMRTISYLGLGWFRVFGPLGTVIWGYIGFLCELLLRHDRMSRLKWSDVLVALKM